MSLVDVKLNLLLYRFRRLTCLEEATVKAPEGEAPRKILLAHSLHDISGLRVTSFEDALAVLGKIPSTLRRRMWALYRANLPEDRYYSSTDLYEAPDAKAYEKRLVDTGEAQTDPREDDLVRRFGLTEAQEAREMEQQMRRDFRRNAWQVPPVPETNHVNPYSWSGLASTAPGRPSAFRIPDSHPRQRREQPGSVFALRCKAKLS